jgi:cation transport ATPase
LKEPILYMYMVILYGFTFTILVKNLISKVPDSSLLYLGGFVVLLVSIPCAMVRSRPCKIVFLWGGELPITDSLT